MAWLTGAIMASIPSFVAIVVWIIRLGTRMDNIEANFRKCQHRQTECQVGLKSDRDALQEALASIAREIGELRGEVTILVRHLNGKHP